MGTYTSFFMASTPFLSIVIPMHNEAEALDGLFATVTPILDSVTPDWEIIAVNDGSRDDTLALLKERAQTEPRLRVIDFSRNFGKEAALTAGIDHASGQAVIPLDADLQDPPELIPELVKEWQDGAQVVLAVRRNRPGDSWMKRHSASLFYRLINRVSTVTIPANAGDFRLMDREVVEAVKSIHERTRFMKGVFAWAGFRTVTVYYDRPERFAGTTSWNYWKLWSFALDGIFSFTTVPLKIWTYLGAVIALTGFTYASLIILRTLIFGTDVPGYPSLMVAILFIGGIQLMSLGILGEYVGRIYREVKGRPIYLVRETINLEKPDAGSLT